MAVLSFSYLFVFCFFDSIGLFCYHNRVISTVSAHTSDGSGFILKVEALSCCVTTGILCASISHDGSTSG